MVNVSMLILLAIAIFLISFSASGLGKKGRSHPKNEASGTINEQNLEIIGDADKTEVEFGYYRYQDDNQIVIKRTEEQQRIFEEYFVVENIKTITCESELKKKSKNFKAISNIFLGIGIILLACPILGWSYISSENVHLILTIIVTIASVVIRIIAGQLMGKFRESIHISIAPRKLLTDEEYEKLVEIKINEMNIAQLGLDKLGIDIDQVKEIHPIIIRDKVINKSSLTVRNKENGSVHSSTQYVTYLYFTNEQLFVYKIQFDMCCNMQDEWTSEFFYKDICDVSSHTSRNVLKIEDFEFEYSTVAFSIIASNSKIGFELDGKNENVESIQAMRQKIREKKSQ